MAFDFDTAQPTQVPASQFDFSTAKPVVENKTQSFREAIKKDLERDIEERREIGRGMALPFLGLAQDIPYKPVQEWAGKKVSEIKKTPEMKSELSRGELINPRTKGELISGLGLAFLPELKIAKAPQAIKAGLPFIQRTLKGAAGAGLYGAATEPVESGKDVYGQKGQAAINYALLGGGFSALAPMVVSLGSKSYNMLKDAFGGDLKEMTESLRKYASTRTGEEANAAHAIAQAAENELKQTKTGIETESAKTQKLLEGLPGYKLETEAGEVKPIPQSKQTIGENIRTQADSLMRSLKKVRSDNADKLKAEAFNFALAKEKAGKRISDTKSYKDLIKNIGNKIQNKETGLYNIPVDAVRSQLTRVRDAIQGKSVNEAGEVVEYPPSFAGLEILRRSLRDRANGLQSEGFDAIGEQQAKELADGVESIMRSFSDGKIDKFLNQYRKDSEPLRVFQSRIGKALVDQQLYGSGSNYASVPAESIVSRVFANKDNYRALIDAFGGNEKQAQNLAKQHFASELEKLGGDPERVNKFLRDNRTILTETDSKKMVESYLTKLRENKASIKDLETKSKDYEKQIEKSKGLQQNFENLQSNINIANSPEQVAGIYDQFRNKLRNENMIDQATYEHMGLEAQSLRKMSDKTNAAKQAIELAKRRILVYGGLGAAGVGGYYLTKGIGD